MTRKRIGFFVVIIVSIIIINSLMHSIDNLWQRQELITTAQTQLQQLKQQNLSMKQKLQKVKQPEFVEEEARDKLFLQKPGEAVIMLPQEYVVQDTSVSPHQEKSQPNWRQWWDIFF